MTLGKRSLSQGLHRQLFLYCVCLFFEVLVLGCNGSLVYSFLITQPLCPKVISHIHAVVPFLLAPTCQVLCYYFYLILF